ncbi:MAG: phenylalanine--tRNA ligase subunit alpha [Minisyncoccia bacterium]
MLDKIQKIQEEFENSINKVKNLQELEQLRIKFIGRKGLINDILKSFKNLSDQEKRNIGPVINKLKLEITERIKNSTSLFQKVNTKNKIDITKPALKISYGHQHPLSRMETEIIDIFHSLNFAVVDGPEIEDEYHNFDALNIPANHPARDMWDTFWIDTKNNKSKLLLRTHTSPVQIRYMETHQPPFQIIVPGRVFRYEATDQSHEINFYQLEGLMVGENVTMANFKFIVESFLYKFFGKNVKLRFRASYFPFVEPGVEVDIKLANKWLEIMGAGMVHKKVFDNVKYNSNKIQGFAFGIGIDRLALIKYKIPDIRLLYEGDLRFIHQF